MIVDISRKFQKYFLIYFGYRNSDSDDLTNLMLNCNAIDTFQNVSYYKAFWNT